MNNIATISQKIYEALPDPLKSACLYFTDPQERDAFFLSALTIIGSNLSNYSGAINGQDIYPTLQLFTVYQQPLQTLQPSTRLAYQVDQKHMRTYHFEKIGMEEDGEKMTPPNWQRLLAIDINYLHILNTLIERDGLGLLYNTEGKSMPAIAADEDKTLLLYNAFYNHPHMYHTLANGQNKCIDPLQLSVCLRGDHQYLQQVIPNSEHQLFSNFSYYIVTENNTKPADIFDDGSKANKAISPLSDLIFKLHEELIYSNDIIFILKEEEQEKFIEYTEGYTTQQRMVFYRVSMIIAMLQYYNHFKSLSRFKEINGTPYALDVTYHIYKVLNSHQQAVGEYLKEHGIEILPQQVTKHLTETEQLAATLHEQGLSYRKIALELYHDEGKFMKVKRMLTRIGRAA